MTFDLESFKIQKCPAAAYYVPDFITLAEEQSILHNLGKVSKVKWTMLSARRLINFGGVPHPRGMISEIIPAWLQVYFDKLSGLSIFDDKKANHCLLNEYLSGQGIMPHLDGPLYYPTIATISCSSHTVLEFHQPFVDDGEISDTVLCKLLVAPRSLLILKDEMYEKYLHSISEVTEDVIDEQYVNIDINKYPIGTVLPREKRISLTIRHVPKASKMKIKF